jgi:sulfatase modifying factor 1
MKIIRFASVIFVFILLFTGCINSVLDIQKSGNADLTSILIDNGTLNPAFDPGIVLYTVNVDGEIETVVIKGEKAEKNASTSASVTLSNLEVGVAQTAIITVIAQNGTRKTYTVTVTRLPLIDYKSKNIGTMKYVPAGSFQRDSNPANISIISKPFRMSEKEITRAQFMAILGYDPCPNDFYSRGMSDPVQRVNWYHAIAFCNKLSIIEGLNPVYSVIGVEGAIDFSEMTYTNIPFAWNSNWNAAIYNKNSNGYRLPTEMEWMWAAMGADKQNPGNINTNGYTKAFSGSDDYNNVDDFVWYSHNSNGKTSPVGSKNANELGLFDMSGNVWEWNWDIFKIYPTGTITDFSGPSTGSTIIFRGGGCWNSGIDISVWYRGNANPDYISNIVGFRVVRQ